ncbi:MAG TPA: hypothetical protein VF195_07795 [Actinomycetota bacterium]
MVYASLFGRLFKIDLVAPEVPRSSVAHRRVVDHALTNEEILFDTGTQPFSKQLADAVETFWRVGVAAQSRTSRPDRGCWLLSPPRGAMSQEIPSVEVRSQEDERDVDRGQGMGEPARQEDVGHGTVFGPERFGNIGQRTAEAVRGEDQTLAADHGGRDRGAPVGRFANPAHSRYTMHDSMENQASVWMALTATSARPALIASPLTALRGRA